MFANYTLKDGKGLLVFLGWEVISGKCKNSTTYCNLIEKDIYIYCSKEKKLDIVADSSGKLYFIFDNQKIYVDDFNHIPLDELIRNINLDKASSTNVIGTIIKESENIGLIIQKESSDNRSQSILYSITGINANNLNIEPVSDEFKSKYGASEINYISLFSKIKRGKIKLVSKSEYQRLENGNLYSIQFLHQAGVYERKIEDLDKEDSLPKDIIGFSFLEYYLDPKTCQKNVRVLRRYSNDSIYQSKSACSLRYQELDRFYKNVLSEYGVENVVLKK